MVNFVIYHWLKRIIFIFGIIQHEVANEEKVVKEYLLILSYQEANNYAYNFGTSWFFRTILDFCLQECGCILKCVTQCKIRKICQIETESRNTKLVFTYLSRHAVVWTEAYVGKMPPGEGVKYLPPPPQ